MRHAYIEEFELVEFKKNIQEHTSVDKVAESIELTAIGFFIGIFSFFATPAGKKLLMVKPLIDNQPFQVYLFPLMIPLEIGETGTALYKLLRADNKNLDKTLEFSSKATKGTVITSAITIGTVAQVAGLAALGAVVPYLFVAAIGLNTLYNLGTAIYHGIKMLQAPKGSALRAAHKDALIKSVVQAVVGAVLVGVIVGLMVAGVSTPVGLAVIAGIGIATLLGSLIVSHVMKKRAKKAALESERRRHKNGYSRMQSEVLAEKQQAITSAFNKGASPQDVKEATKAEGDKHDRFYVRDLSRLLNAAKRKGPEALQNAFINVIDAKITKLEKQIGKAQQKANTRHRLFNMVVPNEEPKRLAKIAGLRELRQKIESYDGENLDRDDISSIVKNHKKIFQSFFHDKSDVELIFDAAKEYFASTSIHDRFNLDVKI